MGRDWAEWGREFEQMFNQQHGRDHGGHRGGHRGGPRGASRGGEWSGQWGTWQWGPPDRRSGPPPWLAGLFGLAQQERPRAPRARRGDVRVAILAVLADGPLNGYQVIQEIAERTQGAWKPSPGSIYPTLQQLEDEGLVVQVEDGGRKAYALTDSGREYVASHPEELAAPWAAMTDTETDGDLRPLLGQVAAAMWQVMAVGTPEQQASAKDAVVELRKKLYGILADGASDEADRR